MVKLDVINKGSAELKEGNKRKIQNENICLLRESNQLPLAFQLNI